MAVALQLAFMTSAFFYGVVFFAVALALFVFAPTLVHQYLGARSRTDGVGRFVRVLSWGAVTNEKVVVLTLRIVLAMIIILGALMTAHAIGLKTWIFDS